MNNPLKGRFYDDVQIWLTIESYNVFIMFGSNILDILINL